MALNPLIICTLATLLSGMADKSTKRNRTDQVRGDALGFLLTRPAMIWRRTNDSDFGFVSCLFLIFYDCCLFFWNQYNHLNWEKTLICVFCGDFFFNILFLTCRICLPVLMTPPYLVTCFMTQIFHLPDKFTYHQTSNISQNLVDNIIVDHSGVAGACRCCSNYISIIDLPFGFNVL